MLAARDQENLIHGHQAAAAAKPLNQGLKQLAPKTPGNKTAKTPLRVPLNDENGTTAFGGGKKTGGKGNENTVFAVKKGGLAESKAFVTPIGTALIEYTSGKYSSTDSAVTRTPESSPLGHENHQCQSPSLPVSSSCSKRE